MKTLLTSLLALSFVALFSGATTINDQQDPIVGIWKGTSLCQQKGSACNDEQVVYHISKASAANTYKCIANKIVNNVEESMGELEFIYDNANNTLTCHSVTRYDGLWKFIVKKNTIEGTLTVDQKILFRTIKLVKS